MEDAAHEISDALIAITINGAIDPPINIMGGNESSWPNVTGAINTQYSFTGSSELQITDADGDANTVILHVDNGVLNVTSGGVSVIGDGSADIIISGTQAQINTVLATLKYTPNTGYTGNDYLTIFTQDSQNAYDNDGVVINIPTIFPSQTVTEADMSSGSNPTGSGDSVSVTLTKPDGQSGFVAESSGTGTYGTWTIDASGSFSYRLTTAATHGTISETLTIQTEDAYGNIIDNTITVTINDDTPTADLAVDTATTLSLDETVGGTDTPVDDYSTADSYGTPIGRASADFLSLGTNNTFGADGPASSSSTVYELVLSGASGVDAGVTTTDGFKIFMFDSSGVIVAREATVTGATGVADASGDVVFTLEINSTSGEITATQYQTLTHPTGGTSSPDEAVTLTSVVGALQAKVTITDGDGDPDTDAQDIGARISFQDDGPTITSGSVTAIDTLTVDDTDLTTNDTANFADNFTSAVDYGADGSGSAAYALVLTGTNVDSGLDTLDGQNIVMNQSGNTITGTGATDGLTYFTIAINTSTGDVTFDQQKVIKHGDTSSNDESATLTAAAGALVLTGTFTDADGDAVTHDLDLGQGGAFVVKDDGPSLSTTAATAASLQVDETTLSTDATVDFSSLFTVTNGADGQKTLAYSLVVTDGTDSGVDDVATGQSVYLYLNSSTNKIEGRVGSSGVADATGAVAFVVSVNASGSVTLDQQRALVHPTTGTSHDEAISLTSGTLALKAAVTDNDDDTASASVDLSGAISFKDDGPNASVDATIENSSSDPHIGLDQSTISGSAITGTADFSVEFDTPDYGSDGAGSVSYALNLASSSVASGLYADNSGAQGNEILLTKVGNDIVGSDGVTEYIRFSVDSTTGVITFKQTNTVWLGSNSVSTHLATNVAGTATSGLVSLTQTVTDNDGDTDSANYDLDGDSFSIVNGIVPDFYVNDVTVNEEAGTLTFTIERQDGSGNLYTGGITSTVDFELSDGTAVVNGDYSYNNSLSGSNGFTAGSNGRYTVSFASGVNRVDVVVSIANDYPAVYEGSESFVIDLHDATNGTISDSQGVGTIYDDGTGGDDDGDSTDNGGDTSQDDDRPTLTIGDATMEEGSTLSFNGSLSNATAFAETFTLSTTLGTAEAGDFASDKTTWSVTYVDSNNATQTLSVAADGSFTLPAGITAFKVLIPTVSDAVYEGDETFTLSATATSSYITDSDTGLGTITDDGSGPDGNDSDSDKDDDRPVLTIGDTTSVEGDALRFPVSLSNATEDDIELSFALTDIDTSSSDYDATSIVVTYVDGSNTTQTITPVNGKYTVPGGVTSLIVKVATNTDSLREADEQLTLSASATQSFVNTNDTGTGTITEINREADLSVSKSVDDQTPDLNGNVVYSIVVTNDGSDTAENVVMNDQLPAGLEFVSADSVNYNATTGVWSVGNMAANTSQTLKITAKVVAVTAINNVAEVSSDTYDPDTTNNRDDGSTDPNGNNQRVDVPEADLSVTKSVDDQTPDLNGNVVYTIVVTNDGSDTAENVVMNDQLPVGLEFVSADSANYNATTGVWTVGNMAANTSQTLKITAKVVAVTAINNVAEVSSDTYDPDTTNNRDDGASDPNGNNQRVNVPEADLSVSKMVDNQSPLVGDNVTYTIVVKNAGVDTAENVVMTDELPDGLVFVSADSSDYDATTGIWTLGDLASGASVTLKIVVQVTGTGELNNIATVTSDTFDPDETDNLDDGSTDTDENGNPIPNNQRVTPLNVELLVTGPEAPVSEGSDVIFVVELSNPMPTDQVIEFSTTPITTSEGELGTITPYYILDGEIIFLEAASNGGFIVPAGVTDLKVAVQSIQDGDLEGLESFSLNASLSDIPGASDSDDGAVIDDGSGVVLLANNGSVDPNGVSDDDTPVIIEPPELSAPVEASTAGPAAPVDPVEVQQAPSDPIPIPEGELVVQRNIPLQEAKVDDNGMTVIDFTIPADTFAHTADLDYTLSAVMVDGSELPAWLVFDAEKGEFRGIVPEGFEGILEVRVIARDSSGRQVETEVRIEVNKGATIPLAGKLHLKDQMQQDNHFAWKSARDKWIAQAKALSKAVRQAS